MKRLCALVVLAGLPLIAEDGQRHKVAVTGLDTVLPQIADGNGWSTRITIANMDNAAAPFRLDFYKDDGTAWAITLRGPATGPGSTCNGTMTSCIATVPVGGSVFLETTGTGALTQGWAYLNAGSLTGGSFHFITGMAVFKGVLPTNDEEAVVPFGSEVDFDLLIPFDNRNGYVTSIALVNPGQTMISSVTATANVSVQFRTTDGTVILNDAFQLAPRQKVAFSTVEKYGAAVKDKNGVIEIIETGNAFITGLGLLFSPRNTFSSVHALAMDPYLLAGAL